MNSSFYEKVINININPYCQSIKGRNKRVLILSTYKQAVMKLLFLFAISFYFISITNACLYQLLLPVIDPPYWEMFGTSTSTTTTAITTTTTTTTVATGRRRRSLGSASKASAIKPFCNELFGLIKTFCPGNAACQVRKKYKNLSINHFLSEMEVYVQKMLSLNKKSAMHVVIDKKKADNYFYVEISNKV